MSAVKFRKQLRSGPLGLVIGKLPRGQLPVPLSTVQAGLAE
jgi:hypothetical protein